MALVDPTLRTVLLGTAALGFVSGCLGTFAVLRRQSLLGDAVSHAALPGVVVAFLLAGKVSLALIVGAAVSGWLAMLAVNAITRQTRIPFDTALAGVLAVFFGAGLMLMSTTQRSGSAGIDRYLFGQAATMLPRDVWAIVGVGGGALLILLLFWKQFKLLAFDREYAKGLGIAVWAFDILLTALLVLAIVLGLESVGVVLMSALVVAPAAAARQWTDRLGLMTLLAGVFGALAGVGGTIVSQELSRSDEQLTIPTGPTIVLTATLLVVVSLMIKMARTRFRTSINKALP